MSSTLVQRHLKSKAVHGKVLEVLGFAVDLYRDLQKVPLTTISPTQDTQDTQDLQWDRSRPKYLPRISPLGYMWLH